MISSVRSCFPFRPSQDDGSRRSANFLKIYPLSNGNEMYGTVDLYKHKKKQQIKKIENVFYLVDEILFQSCWNKDHEFKFIIQQLNLSHFQKKDLAGLVCNQQFEILAATKTMASWAKCSFSKIIGCNLEVWTGIKIPQMSPKRITPNSRLERKVQSAFFIPNIQIFSGNNRIFVDLIGLQMKLYKIMLLHRNGAERVGVDLFKLWSDIFSYVPAQLIQTFQTVFYFKPELDYPLTGRRFQQAIQALALPDFNRSNEIGILCNREYKIVAVASNACDTTGYKVFELIGQAITIFMDPQLADMHRGMSNMTQRFLEILGTQKYWCPKSAFIFFKDDESEEWPRRGFVATAHIFSVANGLYFPILLRKSIDHLGWGARIIQGTSNLVETHSESKENNDLFLEDSLVSNSCPYGNLNQVS